MRSNEGAVIDAGDVPLRVVGTPGLEPEGLAFVVGQGQFALTGDLDGRRGSRSIFGPVDEEARKRSVEQLRSEAPHARWLGGHPVPRLRVMSEGSTLKPFPEARPPHLPDVATRQSPWLFLFGALIAVQIWRLFQGWDPRLNGANAVTAFNYVLSWAAAFAPPLMGFALFYRHPDARRRMPLLVFGILLLSLGELLSALDAPIRELLSNLTPPGDQEFILDTPAEFAYRVFTGLLTIFGLLYLGAGLSTARSRPRARVERPLTVWLAALAFVAAVLSAVDLTRIQVDLTPFLGAQLIIGSIARRDRDVRVGLSHRDCRERMARW